MLVGVAAAANALAITQVVSALGSAGPSLIDSVGTLVINLFGASLKDVAVALFGTNDKLALEVGIVAICLFIGTRLGAAALRRSAAGPVGMAAFGAIGVWAGLSDPLASPGRAVLASCLGAAAGSATFAAFVRRPRPSKSIIPGAPDRPVNADPTVIVASRRAFLGGLAASGGLAVAAAGGAQLLRRAATSAGNVAVRVLPKAKRVVLAPASQPFAVEGTSPYITPNDDFYRIDTALFVPRINADNWSLEIRGRVKNPYRVSYAELLAMDMVEEPITMQCVSNEIGGSLIGTASWLGVPLAALLDRAGLKAGATQIVGRSVDNFTVGFPTEVALDGRTAMVAVGMNGEPLPQRHGYPARLVVAGLYGYVSATKWLREIELTRLEDFDAYWIPRGWAKEAPIKTASRIDVPVRGANLVAGPIPIAGVAWAPTRGISRVEVRIDDGEWTEAQLGNVASSNTWVQWTTTQNVASGDHVLTVRATDGDGVVQTADKAQPNPDGATGYHTKRIRVR